MDNLVTAETQRSQSIFLSLTEFTEDTESFSGFCDPGGMVPTRREFHRAGRQNPLNLSSRFAGNRYCAYQAPTGCSMATVLSWKLQNCGIKSAPAKRDGAFGLILPSQRIRPTIDLLSAYSVPRAKRARDYLSAFPALCATSGW